MVQKGLIAIELMALNDQCHLSSRIEFASCNYNFKGDRQLVVEYYQTPIVNCNMLYIEISHIELATTINNPHVLPS